MTRRTPVLFVLLGLPLVAGVAVAEDGGPPPPPSASGAAPATAAVSVEVMVVYASRTKQRRDAPEIDPKIGDLPELRQDPFSLYDRFELLQKERLPLHVAVPRSLTLPNGRLLVAELLEVLQNDVFRVSTSITRPGGKEFLAKLEVKARRGKPFIVAGQSYRDGILVLVLRVVK
ncbi:MAG TPA: hypothetical protein PLU22_09290 [Polyangiaceae bacterium]|nr:hypothetical protein [Polyangiaceae bacterium]